MGLLFGCSTAVVVINAISLAFLILATITVPVVTSLSLAEADGYKYGLFGYCDGSKCSQATFPYQVSDLSPNTTDWKMDASARNTLAKILIVTPIAAGLTFISFIFNFLSHFQVFGTSLVFYLIGFFFTVLGFFSTAVTCIVTFLLFFPHVTWCAWLLIPAAILNLFAVPLMFFALRTNPNPGSENEDDEEIDDKNLTDLSDGDNFKLHNELKPNDFTGPNTSFTNFNNGSFTSKDVPMSTLKVVTNDSSSVNDQRSGYEKASIHDYSTNKDPTRDYNYNGKIQTQPYGSEGKANLVSAQNYNKGGAVRTEAPSFKPQSAKPDYSTAASSSYPNNIYQSQPPTARSQQRGYQNAPQRPQHQFNSLQQPGGPRGGSSSSGSRPFNSSASNSVITSSNNGGNGVPSGVPTTSSVYDDSPNALGNSNHEPAGSDDYDNDLTNDNDSDFTSVSQRAVNPRYYKGANATPTLFPNEEQQQLVSAPQAAPNLNNTSYSPHPPAQQYQQHQQLPPQSPTYPDYSSSHYVPSSSGNVPNGGSTFSPQPYQQAPASVPASAPSQSQAPRKNTSDALLSTNPDFMVSGPAFQRQQFPKRANPQSAGSYRPAYKRVQGSAGKVSAASLSGDSPYNFK